MAFVIYRRLTGGVFRAATCSSSARWASTKPPDEPGRDSVFQTAKTSAHVQKANNDGVDFQESQGLYNPSAHPRRIVGHWKGIAERDYKRHGSEETKKSVTGRPWILPRRKKLVLRDRSRETFETKLIESLKKNRKEKTFDDRELYNTMADPRLFQQCRPEYKSMCYNNEHPMDKSMEESEDLLRKVTLNGNLATREMSEFFEKLRYLPEKQIRELKSNKDFETFCSRSAERLDLHTHVELIRILGAFVRLKIPPNHPMLKVYELEFRSRVWCLSTNELLCVADIWRCLSCSVPKFLDIMYSYMQLHCMDLNLAQIIQLIYIIGEGRRAPDELMEKLEAMVLRYLSSINLEEIGAICLGFFKTGNGLSDYLMTRFGDIIIENIDEISSYSLVNVLKMFRFTRVIHMEFFRQVGQVVHQRIPSMGTQGIMHITLSFASMRILNEDLMNAVALAIPDRVSYCRSKDIAKFLWSFGVLTYEPPNADVFYSAFINEIRKNLLEFETFPEHFLTCLMALAFCQRFPLDLIQLAFSEKLIMRSTKISLLELKKDLFTIAGSVEIECPEYTGETLLPDLRQEIIEMIVRLSNRDIYVKPEFLEAASLLELMLGGPQYVKNHMILPHTRSKDLEVHLDANNKPVAINADVVNVPQPPLKSFSLQVTDGLMSQLLNKHLKPTPENSEDSPQPRKNNGIEITEDLLSKLTLGKKLTGKPTCHSDTVKLAIQVTHRNHYCYGTQRLVGLHNMKRRQLHKLGYVVVELPYWEWFPLMKCTQSEKLAYLHCKVFGCINDDR